MEGFKFDEEKSNDFFGSSLPNFLKHLSYLNGSDIFHYLFSTFRFS